jgi:uroporphyrinogen decarboxylase
VLDERISARENLLRALTRDDPEYVPVRRLDGSIPGLCSILYHDSAAPVNGPDRWGVVWAGGTPARSPWEPEIASYPVYHPLSDLSAMAGYDFPDPHEPGLLDGLLDGVDREQVLVCGKLFFLLLERAHTLVGMENLLVAMLEQPERVQRLLTRIADYQIGLVQRYLELGVDIIRATDDYGAQNALLMSPPLWRSLFKPELARIVTRVKNGGAMFWLHSCGRVMEIIPDLIEIGIDVLDPVQVTANDQAEAKHLYGRQLSLMGGMDLRLLTLGSPEQVAAEVRKRIELLGQGGGYILAPDSLAPVPRVNYLAYLEAGTRYGRYRQ